MNATSFPNLLHAFFHQWMGQLRNLSRHTVSRYLAPVPTLCLPAQASSRDQPVSN